MCYSYSGGTLAVAYPTKLTALASGCAALLGCTGSGTGDPLATPPADQYGSGARLYELLGPATGWLDNADVDSENCTNIPRDRKVSVTGVTVTVVDEFDETSDGAVGNFYVQDSEQDSPPNPEQYPDFPAYTGITVYAPGFSPPDLRAIPGDVMDMLGTLTEFPGPSGGEFYYCRTLPEISGAMEFRFEGGASEPLTIDVGDLASYEGARQWLGMLVTIKNVTLLEDAYPTDNGRYSFRIDAAPGLQGSEIPTITNELFDLRDFNEGEDVSTPPLLSAGMQLQSVTGIITYFYGVHIAPRSAEDIEL